MIKDILNKNIPLWKVIIFTLVFSLLIGSIFGYLTYKGLVNNITFNKDINNILKTYNKIVNNYYKDVNKSELSNSAIDGMMDYLDEQYSTFMDTNSTDSLNEKLDGNYQGIGIQVSKKGEVADIVVSYVFPNTPAAKAGLLENDIIKKIDNEKITQEMSLEEVVKKIKDKDKITLEITRNKKPLKFNIEVKKINNPVVTTKMFKRNNKKIGYIYLSSFSSDSSKQVEDALNELEKKQIDSLIFDIRSNTGGYLSSCTSIANMFLKKNKIIYMLEEKNKKIKVYDTTDEQRKYPIVVLVDGISASASEILASALKDSYGAIIIGNKTYGKGKVQQTSKLSKDTMVKYTTAKWYTPKGESIDEKGIVPDIEVDLTKKYANNPIDKNDSQLQMAIKVLANE